MGKKKRNETSLGSAGASASAEEPIGTAKRARREPVTTEKPKENNLKEKLKGGSSKTDSAVVKKVTAVSEVKNIKSENIYTDSSSSSDSECEKNLSKNVKKSVTDSNSDSDSDSSDSDSSPTSREEERKEKEKIQAVAKTKNSVINLMSVKSYVPPPKSSSSDSYHSDTEEEDKKRRKKQKKKLQMQLSKKAKRGSMTKTQEVKQEVQSDLDEDGADVVPSNNDEVPDWPESDYTELIQRMEAQIPAKDNQKFDSRAAKLDWEKIAFGNYSPEECMEVWLTISKRIRRFRTLQEMLQDAKEWVTEPWTNFYRGSKKNRHPDMPARPLSTYMIYYMDHKDRVALENPGIEMTQVSKIISEMYKKLSPEEREKYTELAAQHRQDFDMKISEFYRVHPDLAQRLQQKKTQAKEVTTKGPRKPNNPFKAQLKTYGEESVVDKKALEEQVKEKWKNLSEKKKLIWINWALEDLKRYEQEVRVYQLEHPSFVPPNLSKSILNKEERTIKERSSGKPVKPPNSAYSLFSRLMLQSDPYVKSIPPKERMAEISKKWKEVSDEQKAKFEDKVREMQDDYKLEFASYLEGLSPEERDEELKRRQPKRKSIKTKKKEVNNSSIVNKTSSKDKMTASLNLYKGEPIPPPVRVFDVFSQSFVSDRPRASEPERLKEALQAWNALSEAKKESFRKKHEELKQKYIEDFENFLKGLSPDELKEFSVMKELAKKNKEAKEQRELINGTSRDSNEDSEDEDGSSSDSDSDDSDSGKSSKSSSSSEDSES